MLTGQKLLDKVQSMSSATKRQLCEATGYITTTPGGKTSAQWNSLQSALLNAKGIDLPTANGGGPRPSFSTSTLSNGNVVVGRSYARLLGAQPGERFDIEVDKDNRQIVLTLSE